MRLAPNWPDLAGSPEMRDEPPLSARVVESQWLTSSYAGHALSLGSSPTTYPKMGPALRLWQAGTLAHQAGADRNLPPVSASWGTPGARAAKRDDSTWAAVGGVDAARDCRKILGMNGSVLLGRQLVQRLQNVARRTGSKTPRARTRAHLHLPERGENWGLLEAAIRHSVTQIHVDDLDGKPLSQCLLHIVQRRFETNGVEGQRPAARLAWDRRASRLQVRTNGQRVNAHNRLRRTVEACVLPPGQMAARLTGLPSRARSC